MNYGDFKKLAYDERLPMEVVLAQAIYDGVLDVNTVLVAYTNALEKERRISHMRFEEACINLTQMLGTNFKGKDKEKAIKRAIHTFNLNRSLVPHVHDDQYGYTEDDEKEWDNFCKTIYGTDLKK